VTTSATGRGRIAVYLAALLVVFVDQATKYVIQATIPLYESLSVIDGFFSLTHVRNPGAAFGFLTQVSPAYRFAFLVTVTLAVIVLIIFFLERNREAGAILNAALALVLGGAAGNLIDRVSQGEVIDFLDFYIGTWHWPAFNMADSAISVGAFLLIIDMVMRKKKD
jgi:signal peptidase II